MSKKPIDFEKEEYELRIKALSERICTLEGENNRLKMILKENDLLDEAEAQNIMTAEEEICIRGIQQILELVRLKTFTNVDIKNFDILHNHLLKIRGQAPVEAKKTKPTNVAELLKIVKDSSVS